ncbi:YkgJ family cysteine cluster protein [Magnetococcales bacterium HHB-1]
MELSPARRYTPNHRRKKKWLKILSQAYHLMDQYIETHLKEETKKQGRSVACQTGCTVCCHNFAIAITGIEIFGLAWFAVEQIQDQTTREQLKQNLLNHEDSAICPFLIDQTCAAYSMRPFACRAVHVFGIPCQPGENLLETREADVWYPDKEIAQTVSLEILPFFGISGKKMKKTAYRRGFLLQHTFSMDEYDWHEIAEMIP